MGHRGGGPKLIVDPTPLFEWAESKGISMRELARLTDARDETLRRWKDTGIADYYRCDVIATKVGLWIGDWPVLKDRESPSTHDESAAA